MLWRWPPNVSVSCTHRNTLTKNILRLLSAELPSEQALLRELVEQYFSNVHYLRCFAFVHKPSFMRQLDHSSDRNQEDDALLYMICAQGAK